MKYNTTVSAALNMSIPDSSEYRENSLLLQTIVLGSLAILGFGGNITILVTGVRRLFCVSDLRLRQEYRTSFITNLAVADILVLLYGVPLHLSQEKGIPMNELICRYLVPLRDVLVLISVLTIMAISFERAVAIINPFSLETSQHLTKYWIIVIWVVAYLLAGLPMIFVMTSEAGQYCLPKWSSIRLQKAHQTCAILLIIIPGLLTTLSYSFCIRSLHKLRQRRKSNSESGIQQWSFIKQTRSVSRIAVVLVFIFWLCNLPLVTFQLCIQYQLITPTPESHAYTRAVLTCLFFAASVLNPIVLIVMSPLYRKNATACVQYIFSRGNGIIRYRSRVQYSRESTGNRSEHISIANNEIAGENSANGFALTARKQSVSGVE